MSVKQRTAFDWKRFWCPPGGHYSLDDRGYLLDPECEYAKCRQPDVVSFEQVQDKPCLALLGEPGIGKSTALQACVTQLRELIEARGERLLVVDLRPYGSEDHLLRDLGDAPEFGAWSAGSGILHLFFDSLDECHMRIPHVGSLLIGFLKKHEGRIDRLRLRIACRTAEWPTQLETGLPDLWGHDRYSAFELLPLRRRDVAQAAKVSGFDEEGFLSAVEKVDAQPLAARPITLQFLLSAFRGEGSLPATKVRLYEHGCRLLCTEVSQSRCDAGDRGKLDPDRRLVLAARIAAVTTLCGKAAVCISPGPTVLPEDMIPMASLAGGREQATGMAFDVDENSLREVLGTGLFCGRGPGLLGFSHQTYAEYLTAVYLVNHELDLAQITSLVCHRDDPQHPVVPQLAETAAWLASMRRDVFERVMATDPQVLLRSDAAVLDSSHRADLLAALLRKFDAGELSDWNLSLRSYYGRFRHPGLADQLRPFIADKTKNIVVRRVAIDIAEATEVARLQDLLVQLALDSNEANEIRYQATSAIAEMGDNGHRQQLATLLSTNEREDPDDQVRGSAMRALWPRRLVSLEDILSTIAPQRRRNLTGSYEVFLGWEFVPHLESSEIAVVLHWLCQYHEKYPSDESMGVRRLSDKVVMFAWNHLDDEPTRVALADYALRQEHDGILSSLADETERQVLSEGKSHRRRLVQAILRRMSDLHKQGWWLTWASSSLLGNVDLPWLLNESCISGETEISRRYAHLARSVFNLNDAGDVTLIMAAAETTPAAREAFAHWLVPVTLGSPEAHKLRQEYEHYSDLTSHRAEADPIDPPVTERVRGLLDRFEAGAADAWWQLNYSMLFDAAGRASGPNELEDDLRSLPGWKDADNATRQRIIRGAKSYLDAGDPDDNAWVGTNILHRPAFAGYRALVLLANEDSTALKALRADLWARWAASIVGFPVSVSMAGNREPALGLVNQAYHNSPDAVISALFRVIDYENNQESLSHLTILQKMQECWDERLCEAMLAKARDPKLKPSCLRDLLEDLIEHGCAGAQAYAEALLAMPLATNVGARELGREAAVSLLLFASDGGWNSVWPAVESDAEFGRSVLEVVATDHRERRTGSLTMRLTEEQVADLYFWLAKQYPHAEDPDHDGAHCVGSREAVAQLRDNLLRRLEDRGTMEAVAAIQRIANELPALQWLKYTVLSARDKAISQTWLPPLPGDVLALCAVPNSRLVRNGGELQDVLMGALGQINAELQGETAAAPQLWNLPTSAKDTETRIRPKNESFLSDWLSLQLKARLGGRGIIGLREVQIRSGQGIGGVRSAGECTDLYVVATVPGLADGTNEEVWVIVEVKGCWHGEVKTAMETQLVGRYLKDNECRHGIYVVGWFLCPQWDDRDSRKTSTPQWPIEQAAAFFLAQAEKCSSGGLQIRSVILNTALRWKSGRVVDPRPFTAFRPFF